MTEAEIEIHMIDSLGFLLDEGRAPWIAYDNAGAIWGVGPDRDDAMGEGAMHAREWATAEHRDVPALQAAPARPILVELVGDLGGGAVEWRLDKLGIATLSGDQGRAIFRERVLERLLFDLEDDEHGSPEAFQDFCLKWLRAWPKVETRFVEATNA